MSILRVTPNRSIVIDLKENDSMELLIETRSQATKPDHKYERHTTKLIITSKDNVVIAKTYNV